MVAHSPNPAPLPQTPNRQRFAPSETHSAQVLADLADPTQSLLAVARTHNTSIESLSLWLSRPEIAERISSMRSAAAVRTRWLAADHLPACAELASRIVRSSLESPSLNAPDSALRAARLLLRLATFDPDARPRSAPISKLRPTQNSTPSPNPTPEPTRPIAEGPPERREQPDPFDPPDTAEQPSLHLPPGLLTSLLPSFKDSDRNPFLPEPGLVKTAPNQRAVVKMRLKIQRKQILGDAFKFLLDHNCCTEADLPLARLEIESFYLRGESELPAPIHQAARPPPPTRAQSGSENKADLETPALGAQFDTGA